MFVFKKWFEKKKNRKSIQIFLYPISTTSKIVNIEIIFNINEEKISIFDNIFWIKLFQNKKK